MRRGDLVTVALRGEQGKPRPALVVQSDLYAEFPAVAVLPITSTLLSGSPLRIDVVPDEFNGLTKPSQVMVDKIQAPSRDRLGRVIGHLDETTFVAVERAPALFVGFV